MRIAGNRGSMTSGTDDDVCVGKFRAVARMIKVEVAEDDRVD